MTEQMTGTMRAIVVDEDEARTMRWAEVERPTPAPGEVLIRTQATAVNRADLAQRAGRYPPPPGASPILGLEVAGTIAACGEGVVGWSEGDRVACLLTGGGYAEYVTAPADLLLPVPEGMSWEVAAAFPEVFTTAWVNLFGEADLRAGETLLLHAAASGVGCAAIQLAAAYNARVIGVCGGDKHAFLRERFGDALEGGALIDRHTQRFDDEALALTDGRGVDVILDPVGGANLERNVKTLARRGRLVNIGLLGGATGTLPMGLLLVKRLRVIGSVLRARPLDEKRAIMDEVREHVWPRYIAGELVPVIEATMPLASAAEAHDLLATNTTVGKIILTA